MKLSKFLLDDKNSNETCVFRKEKISTENVACFYQLANIFNLPVLHKTTFEYIDRSLTIINDVQSFQELDYTCILKIKLYSSSKKLSLPFKIVKQYSI